MPSVSLPTSMNTASLNKRNPRTLFGGRSFCDDGDLSITTTCTLLSSGSSTPRTVSSIHGQPPIRKAPARSVKKKCCLYELPAQYKVLNSTPTDPYSNDPVLKAIPPPVKPHLMFATKTSPSSPLRTSTCRRKGKCIPYADRIVRLRDRRIGRNSFSSLLRTNHSTTVWYIVYVPLSMAQTVRTNSKLAVLDSHGGVFRARGDVIVSVDGRNANRYNFQKLLRMPSFASQTYKELRLRHVSVHC